LDLHEMAAKFDPAGIDEIIPGVYLGGEWSAKSRGKLLALGITHILTVAPIPPTFPEMFQYLVHPIEDNGSEADLLVHFPALFAFIDTARQSGGAVLVHCHAGASRSASVVIAYCMREQVAGGPQLEPNLSHVVARRLVVAPHPGFYDQLLEYEQQLCRSLDLVSH
jgi:hypothetical protein